MEIVKLANVDVEDSEQYLTTPTLWVRCSGGSLPAVKRRGEGLGVHGFRLPAGGTYDFMTYYGALSLRKWALYADVRDFELHVTARGRYAVTVEYADAWAYPSTVVDGERLEFDDRGGLATHVIGVAAGERPNAHGAVPVLVGFRVETQDDCDFRTVGWFAHAGSVRDVRLAICTTTFKKERYIAANVGKIRRDLLYGTAEEYERLRGDDAFDEVSAHLVMNVVDNGRTLDAEGLSGGGVRVIPNVNAGGAGGFARGMVEAVDEGATHALMMDDDVSFCTEAFVRTFNLLRVVRDEYADAFVSGAMLSMYDVDIQSEDTGFMNYRGYCQPVKPPLRLSLTHEVVHNEAFEPTLYRKECQDIRQRYAAWWYCCIPVTQIRRRGLPLPLFVRFDDVEYALRDGDDAGRRFMTMNGICVWHEPFFLRYDAAVERYQTTRNALIARAASGIAPMSDFDSMIKEAFYLEVRRLNYADAELVCEGVEDFLAGPDVCFAPGFAERRFLETHRAREQAMPFDEARGALLELGIDLDDVEPVDVQHDRSRTLAERVRDLLTFAGHDVTRLLRGGAGRGIRAGSGMAGGPGKADAAAGEAGGGTDRRHAHARKVAIMGRDAGAYKPGETRDADVIVAIDIPNQRVSLRWRDNDRFAELVRRFRRDMRQLSARRAELADAYRRAAERMRTREAWERYLGMGEGPAQGAEAPVDPTRSDGR